MTKKSTTALAKIDRNVSLAQLVWAVDQNLVLLDDVPRDRNKQIREGARLNIPNYGYFGGKFKVSISASNPAEDNHGKISESLQISKNKVSHLIFDIEIPESDQAKVLSECDTFWDRDGLRDDAIKYSLFSLTHNIAKKFIVCANISKPGSIRTQKGYFHIDGRKFDIFDFNSNIFRGINIEESRSIRLFRDLPFVDVRNWYSNLQGIFVGKPTNEAEVAVCNFISLFDENSDLSGARDLIWSFAGLESLLAESESGIVSQLRQKLIAIFGNQVDIKDFDKKIRETYQIRSNIIHGKTRDIPTLQGHFMQKSTEPARQDQQDAADFAMYILTSLIQYCCQNGLSNIKFKTVTI